MVGHSGERHQTGRSTKLKTISQKRRTHIYFSIPKPKKQRTKKRLQSSPGGIKEKIERLEAGNEALREGQGGQTALATLLDEANKRNENLRDQLKTANERIISLTHIDDPTLKGAELAKQLKQIIELNEQKAIHTVLWIEGIPYKAKLPFALKKTTAKEKTYFFHKNLLYLG
uniref:Hook C-terminal domain-containing protein n=1 Tax=Megaselia scalaris TaxID=36166 RepID=T1GLY8_MEGSC